MMSGDHTWMMGGMWLVYLFFWGLVIAGVILVVKWFLGREGSVDRESAMEILQKRYARGEIDQAQFEKMRQELEGQKR